MSSARPMTRDALMPGAGSSSYSVTTGPGPHLHDLAAHAVILEHGFEHAGVLGQRLLVDRLGASRRRVGQQIRATAAPAPAPQRDRAPAAPPARTRRAGDDRLCPRQHQPHQPAPLSDSGAAPSPATGRRRRRAAYRDGSSAARAAAAAGSRPNGRRGSTASGSARTGIGRGSGSCRAWRAALPRPHQQAAERRRAASRRAASRPAPRPAPLPSSRAIARPTGR